MPVPLFVWHYWFAWYPVRSQSEERWIFLEVCERRALKDDNGRIFWSYRSAPPRPDPGQGAGA